MFYCFQMQQQQYFEENFDDLTLGEETKMDIQEEVPLGISTSSAAQQRNQPRPLLQQIEDQDAYIRELSLHLDPAIITSEQQAQLATEAIKKAFLTVGYLVAECDTADQRRETADAFNQAAAQYAKTALACQQQLEQIDGRFYEIYDKMMHLTFKGMDIQQQLFTNQLAAWAMAHCHQVAGLNRPLGDVRQDLPPTYHDFHIPQPPPEVAQEFKPYLPQHASASKQRRHNIYRLLQPPVM